MGGRSSRRINFDSRTQLRFQDSAVIPRHMCDSGTRLCPGVSCAATADTIKPVRRPVPATKLFLTVFSACGKHRTSTAAHATVDGVLDALFLLRLIPFLCGKSPDCANRSNDKTTDQNIYDMTQEIFHIINSFQITTGIIPQIGPYKKIDTRKFLL